MSKFDANFHIIKDPVHGSMQFTNSENSWIKPFINSENFQRLRHIKQLGLGDWIFPGAVHTRFNHGIGCCYVASQICNKLNLSAEDKQIVMLACLLHDIGHGPFSHAFEEIFYGKAISHEMWTPFFLADYSYNEFLTCFNKENADFALDSRKFKIIENLITHQDGSTQLLADIVSSQLDADRLDYLLRDSHFCGVSYGQYDFSWLLHCLAIIEYDGTSRLGITRKGVGVIEHYLMARRLMLSNVYHHAKKHAAEFLLTEFLKELAEAVISGQASTPITESCLGQFLAQTSYFNREVQNTNDKKPLIKAFLNKNYALYKKLTDYDIFLTIRELASSDENDESIVALAKRLYNRRIPKVLAFAEEHLPKVENLIAELRENSTTLLKPWQIGLLNLKHQLYQGKRDPILVCDKLGKIQDIHASSAIIGAFSSIKEVSCLVCIDRDIVGLPTIKNFMKELSKLL